MNIALLKAANGLQIKIPLIVEINPMTIPTNIISGLNRTIAAPERKRIIAKNGTLAETKTEKIIICLLDLFRELILFAIK